MLLNNRKRTWMGILAIMLSVSAGSCYYDKEELLYRDNTGQPDACATVPASFTTDVLPLITSKCAISGCHDATASGGFTFHNYNQISAAKNMIHTQAVIQRTMPATGSLSTAQINILRCWIESGGLNN